MVVLMPFIMLIAFDGFKTLRGMIPACLVGGLGFAVPSIIGASTMGADLAGIGGAVCAMALLVVYAKKFPIKDPEYEIDDYNENFSITPGAAVRAWLVFLLIFVFLVICSIPAVSAVLKTVVTKVMIYTGPDAAPTSFQWITTPTILFVSAVIAVLFATMVPALFIIWVPVPFSPV